jgi:hypothetical protein
MSIPRRPACALRVGLFPRTASAVMNLMQYCFQKNAYVLMTLLAMAMVAPVKAQQISLGHAQTGKYRAYQEWLIRNVLLNFGIGRSEILLQESLLQYAAKCNAATGIQVPSFSCGDGVEVPGQGTRPAHSGNTCDRPNVLNQTCDPGSRFQVLPGQSADAVAVAHCRKDGQTDLKGPLYNDIAVIQYNKENGALCFYQALTNLPGQNIPSPSKGEEAPWSDGKPHWISPEGTEAIGCTGCHDNGGFIRSEYLAQLKTPPHALPNFPNGFNNLSTPAKYVGLAFAARRSWSIKTALDPKDRGQSCTACHRLAVPNRMAFNRINGTAAHFATQSTAKIESSAKNPHGPNSPIWMRPGQIFYQPEVEASAKKYKDCAVAFFNSGFKSAPSGCEIQPLGEPFPGLDVATIIELIQIPMR